MFQTKVLDINTVFKLTLIDKKEVKDCTSGYPIMTKTGRYIIRGNVKFKIV